MVKRFCESCDVLRKNSRKPRLDYTGNRDGTLSKTRQRTERKLNSRTFLIKIQILDQKDLAHAVVVVVVVDHFCRHRSSRPLSCMLLLAFCSNLGRVHASRDFRTDFGLKRVSSTRCKPSRLEGRGERVAGSKDRGARDLVISVCLSRPFFASLREDEEKMKILLVFALVLWGFDAKNRGLYIHDQKPKGLRESIHFIFRQQTSQY